MRAMVHSRETVAKKRSRFFQYGGFFPIIRGYAREPAEGSNALTGRFMTRSFGNV